jgi:MFS family permease
MSQQPNMLTVLRNRDFLRFEISVTLATLAAEILTVAVGWMIYDISRDPFDLGLIGLVQFLPTLLLVLVTGTVADSFPRHRIIIACLAVEFIAIFGIFLVWRGGNHEIWPILCLIALLGAGRAFYSPAAHALAPNLVKREEIGAAIACSTASWQCGAIAGPALGGFLYGISPTLAFSTALGMIVISILSAIGIRRIDPKRTRDEEMLGAILGGFRYMLREKIVLGATTLDLFAVLLGSTVVLLPIYARDILIGSPWELGLLRAAIGIGALAMALYLGVYPIRRRAGHIMFAAVAVFGLGTIVFGLSTSLYLSIAALALMGASDMISVYIREVLIQLWTPDEVRGRVTAVNFVLINASNELGTFRAGSSAALFGPVFATVAGGICTLLVTMLWIWWFPKLRRADDISGADAPRRTADTPTSNTPAA